jgi:ribosomal protein L37AE/L43A
MMPDYRPDAPVTRPAKCPECDGKAIDTLAKVFSPTTVWRCRACDQTWTIRSHAASLPQPR